jgi:B-glycosidase
LGLQNLRPLSSEGINNVLNNDSHTKISEKLYANALTLLKDEKQLFPLREKEVYYLPLEEASHEVFLQELSKEIKVKKISFKEIQSIPENAVVIIGLHKDNSTAYKPYKVSWESKRLINQVKSRNKVILNVFGSPYALQDVDISGISSVLVSYENNPFSMKATAEAYLGKQKINGRLPVVVNEQIKYGMGIDVPKQK